MNPTARDWFDRGLAWSPAQPVFRWHTSGRLAVLAYHEVGDAVPFQRQLDHLRRVARPVTLDEVAGAAAGRRALPDRATLITFDDGDRTVADVAMPMLRERGLPAVAFVVAGVIGTSDPFWWVEVEAMVRAGGRAEGIEGMSSEEAVRSLKRTSDDHRLAVLNALSRSGGAPAPRTPQLRVKDLLELESAGIAIGNHSLTHPCLAHCGDEKVRDEIERSHSLLTEALGHSPSSFAYPDGDCDDRVARAVGDAGYELGFLFDHRHASIRPGNAMRLSRLRTNSSAGLERFRIILSGLHPAIHHARGRA